MLKDRCDAIEECYEFTLAYAAQGLPGDQGSASGGQLHHQLGRAVEALTGIATAFWEEVQQMGLRPEEPYQVFRGVLDRDATDSLAAIQMVLAQPSISSQ